MQGERWTRLSPLLDELLELTGEARVGRLAEIAVTDPQLAAELERLMSLEEQRPDFMSEPVVNASLFTTQPGQEIGPYRLVSPIGEGGMGQVWLAVRADGLYERRVALKLLRPGLGDVGLHARFTRERQILARLGHAHIARLLDAGISQDGQPYLALDYVRGDPITDYCRSRSLDLDTRLQLFAQVCAAVSHAHANLVVHRDLKPSNILVTSAGEVCLLDFGIAKLLDQEPQALEITRTGSRAFTLHYAAPEQLRGEVITTMTDVYALGVVLYELLADSKPYELTRQSDAAWEEAILDAEPGKPSQVAARRARETGSVLDKRRARQLAGDLDNIVLKALSKLPEHRYSSVEALAQDLRRHLEGQPVQARAQSLAYRTRKYLRRHALGLGVGLGVGGLLVVALAIVSWQARRALSEAARAQAMQDFVVALFENSGDSSNERGVDVRVLLDAGVSRADSELALQPRAQAELLGLIARLRSGLGDDAEALRLLDRQQQLLAILGDDVPDALLLESLALRGQSLRELGRNGDCLQALAPLRERAGGMAGGEASAAAEFLSQLGRCQAGLGNRTIARGHFERALRLRELAGGSAALLAESENDLALLVLADRRHDAAIRDLRSALAHLRSSGGEQNSLGVEIWRNLGAAYAAQSNRVESEAAYRQALAISLGRFGASHTRTSQVQADLAGVLAGNGKLREAARLLSLAQVRLSARWGADSPQLGAQQSLRALLALELGQPAEAETLLADAIRIWRRRGELPAHSWDLCHLAQAQEEAQRREQAAASRRECLALVTQRPDARTPAVIGLIAQSALDREDAREAAAWLSRMPAHAVSSNVAVGVMRARLAQLAGAPDAAQQAADALARIPSDVGHRRLRWRAQSLLAAGQCRGGRVEEGAALREKTLLEVRAAEPEHVRQMRLLDALSAACAGGRG